MANELMIPEAGTVPSYIMNPALAKQANEDASAGVSAGFPARVKAFQRTWNMVDSNGDEAAYPPAKLVADDAGNVYLPMIVLRAKKALSKTWFAQGYNKDLPGVAPDCMSSDSIRPDISIVEPQSDVCATCPQNAWGSGTDESGTATKGKACTDSKILAVFIPGFGVHSFKITPASLKNWGMYVKQMSAAGIPLGMVKTLAGFDLTSTFQQVIFRFGGYIPEDSIPKLAELAQSDESEEIVGAPVAALPVPPVAPTLVAPPANEAVDDLELGLGEPPAPTAEEIAAAEALAAEEAEKAAKKKAAAVKAAATRKKNAEIKAAKEAAEAAALAAAPSDDIDLGLDAPAAAPAAAPATDQELRDELGL